MKGNKTKQMDRHQLVLKPNKNLPLCLRGREIPLGFYSSGKTLESCKTIPTPTSCTSHVSRSSLLTQTYRFTQHEYVSGQPICLPQVCEHCELLCKQLNVAKLCRVLSHEGRDETFRELLTNLHTTLKGKQQRLVHKNYHSLVLFQSGMCFLLY